ncbi:MAG: MarR family transcriptional regulator [Clostridiales bacterium]|nr:MarR family transcriptional regulator [Clostridiales bacterium]
MYRCDRRITMRDDIDKVEYASMLYDFYGSLLSEAKNEVMALYHEDNLSLSEIAEELGTSRQAVHYTLKKAEKALEGYEEKLGLIAAYEKNQRIAAEALKIAENGLATDKDMKKLSGLIRELAE